MSGACLFPCLSVAPSPWPLPCLLPSLIVPGVPHFLIKPLSLYISCTLHCALSVHPTVRYPGLSSCCPSFTSSEVVSRFLFCAISLPFFCQFMFCFPFNLPVFSVYWGVYVISCSVLFPSGMHLCYLSFLSLTLVCICVPPFCKCFWHAGSFKIFWSRHFKHEAYLNLKLKPMKSQMPFYTLTKEKKHKANSKPNQSFLSQPRW